MNEHRANGRGYAARNNDNNNKKGNTRKCVFRNYAAFIAKGSKKEKKYILTAQLKGGV